MGTKKNIEYLWHKNNDDMAQFWEKRCRQTYLNYPNTDIPKGFIGEGSGNRIVAPEKLPADVLGKRSILDAGLAVNTRGYYHSRSKKNFHIALFIQSGNFSVRFDGVRRDAKKGDVILVPKGCTTEENVRCAQTGVYWLHVKSSPEWDALFGDKVILRKSRKFQEIIFALGMYEREVYSKDRSVIFLENIADIIIELLKREFDNPRSFSRRISLDLLLEEIRKSPSKDWSREAAAKLMRTSPAVLDAECVKSHSMKFSKIVLKTRMQKTLELLRGEDMNYPQIAKAVGYANTSSLSKIFKAYYGKSLRNFKSF